MRKILRAYKNRKRRERSKRYIYTSRILTAVGLAYLFLLIFPQPLFAYSARIGRFNFYSDRPIPSEIEDVVEQAAVKLSTSPFYAETDSFSIYIATDRWRRTLLMPRSPGAFGVSMVLTGNTVLNRCDIVNNICTNDQPNFNKRPMHAVLAHECMHQLLIRDLGMIAYLQLPAWKNEGYCEYVAGDPSFDVVRGETLVRDGKSHGSHAFRYLTYLFAVRSCLDDQGLQPRQFLSDSLDFRVSLEAYVRSQNGG